MSFLKNTLGVFIEFESDTPEDVENNKPINTEISNDVLLNTSITKTISQSEIEKFEKYFNDLFENANLPGPDYYEFYKTMETLEPHIHDEKARISATFASLSIQGLTKEKLLDTANKYIEIIKKDRDEFNKALADKTSIEIGKRKLEQEDIERKIKENSDIVQKLTKEISDYQLKIEKLKSEVEETEKRINSNSEGYKLSSDAILNKISVDVKKINETI